MAITLKIDGIELWFLYTALFCNVIHLCVKFEVTSFYTLEVMHRTKIHSTNFKRAITRNKNGKGLKFLYTALLLNVIYLWLKFEVTSFHTLEVMPHTKIPSKNLQRAIT